MPIMQHDPDIVETIQRAVHAQGMATALAFVLGYLRIMYDEKEPRPIRRLIEATLGAVLVFIIGMTCENFGVSPGWSYAAAGFVGVLGVDQVRMLAQKWAKAKVK